MAIDKAWFDEMEARIPKGRVRTRFAPSPTGYMHVGNLRTALYTYLIAKSMGGDFLLRIEDTDQNRLVEGAVDIIYATMKKCGLQHDEGPDVGGPVGPYVQTERRSLYGKYAELPPFEQTFRFLVLFQGLRILLLTKQRFSEIKVSLKRVVVFV